MGVIGAALGAAGSIFGGIAASRAMKKLKRNIEEQREKNQNWYDRRYNEDASQRGDAQRVLTQTADILKKRNRGAMGSAAVMGGTEESAAATKAANNAAIADAVSKISASADARKDAIESAYQERDANLVGQLNGLEQGRANAIAGAVKGVAGAAGGIEDFFGKAGKDSE